MEGTGYPGYATDDEELPAKLPALGGCVAAVIIVEDSGDISEEDQEVGKDASRNNGRNSSHDQDESFGNCGVGEEGKEGRRGCGLLVRFGCPCFLDLPRCLRKQGLLY
jgi:hypothetical protein